MLPRTPATLFNEFKQIKNEKAQIDFIQKLNPNEIVEFSTQDLLDEKDPSPTAIHWITRNLNTPIVSTLISKLHTKGIEEQRYNSDKTIPPVLDSILCKDYRDTGGNLLATLIEKRPQIEKLELLKKFIDLTSSQSLDQAVCARYINGGTAVHSAILFLPSEEFQYFISRISDKSFNYAIKFKWKGANGKESTGYQLAERRCPPDIYKMLNNSGPAKFEDYIVILNKLNRENISYLPCRYQNFDSIVAAFNKISPFAEKANPYDLNNNMYILLEQNESLTPDERQFIIKLIVSFRQACVLNIP